MPSPYPQVPVKRFLMVSAELIVLTALSYGLFLLCANLYTRHNTFPYSWHPDEPGKASQLRSDIRNYNHPQLLLEATLWLGHYENGPRWPQPYPQTQAIVETGRRASAYLAAMGAVLLAWAGYFAAGRIGFLLAAAGAGLCPAILCHAHYMKEDASLCFGVAAVICVGAAMTWRWHWTIMLLLAAALGGACGLAASGKYVGAVMVVPAVLLALMVTWRRWWIMPLLPLIIVGCGWETWKIVNYRAYENWDTFQARFEIEKNHGLEGHDNVQIPRPNLYCSRLAWDEAMPHIKLLAVATPLALLVMRRRRKADRDHGSRLCIRRHGWLGILWLVMCLIAFAAVLSQNTIPFYRYALPLTLMLYTTAAIGAAWVAAALETRFTPDWLIGLGLLALIASLQWDRCQDYLSQFANDTHGLVRQWVNTLPAGTYIVCDSYTELDTSWRPGGFRTRANIERYRFAPDAGSVDDLIRRRVQYVIVASSSFDRYLDPATTWTEDPAHFHEHQNFYQTLFAKYPIVKSWVAEHPMRAFANPDMYVFKLPEPPPEPRRARGWFSR